MEEVNEKMVGDMAVATAIQSVAIVYLVVGLAALGLLYGVLRFMGNVLHPKSKQARELVTDLYVIGMIRQFAVKDGINLEDEMKNLRKIEKWEKAGKRQLDYVVESELNERIIAESEKKVEEIQNSKSKAEKAK